MGRCELVFAGEPISQSAAAEPQDGVDLRTPATRRHGGSSAASAPEALPARPCSAVPCGHGDRSEPPHPSTLLIS